MAYPSSVDSGTSNASVSSDGTAIPSSSTLLGASDGTNLQPLQVESSSNNNLRVGVYSGANEATVTASNALKVDGSAVTQPVSGTVSITSNSAVNVAQVNGTTTDTNSGTKSAGTQRVVLATDQPALTNALLTSPQSATSGGSTPFHALSGASTNSTNVKASAGQIYGLRISNTTASALYFKLYDKATAPTVGTDTPKTTIQIPANATVICAFPVGLAFASGIGIGATGAATDADTTATTSNALIMDLDYK